MVDFVQVVALVIAQVCTTGNHYYKAVVVYNSVHC